MQIVVMLFGVLLAFQFGFRRGQRDILRFLQDYSLPRNAVSALERKFGSHVGDVFFLRTMKRVSSLADLKTVVEMYGERTIVRIAFVQFIADKSTEELRKFWPQEKGTPMFADEWHMRFHS